MNCWIFIWKSYWNQFTDKSDNLVYFISTIIWLVLIIRAWRRPDRRFLAGRLALTTLAVAALALAGLRPDRPVAAAPDSALLLTGRAPAATVDSLRRAAAPEYLFGLDSTYTWRKVISVPDPDYIFRHYPAVRRLHVVGDGLPDYLLGQLAEREARFYLNEAPAGFSGIHYPYRAFAGDTLRLSGIYRHDGEGLRRLVLEGPAGTTPLAEVGSAGPHPFRATVPLQAPGRYLLNLRVADAGGNGFQQEKIPVEVAAATKPRLLIVNRAPSFEAKYLKNWLADQGYPVGVRSAVSRDRFVTEFDNREPVDLQPLTAERLAAFDLLLLDEATLAGLDPAERQAVTAAVRAGLGLVLLPADEPAPLTPAERRFFFDFPQRSGGPLFRPPGLESNLPKKPSVLLEANDIFPLVRGQSGQLLAAFRPHGRGRLALSLMQETYRLQLLGETETYARLWTPLLEGVARRPEAPRRWELPEPLLIFPDRPVAFQLIQDENLPPIRVIPPDSVPVAVAPIQYPLLADQWSAAFWPRRPGWHRLAVEGAEPDGSFYVQQPGAWNSLRLTRQIAANRRWAQEHPATLMTNTEKVVVEKPYPLIWFYLVFLLAAGLLWLEERW